MSLPGTAFLALWNDRGGDRNDYETWHSREHVPERLGIPGILAGRRYVNGQGPLPAYFTLYPLSDLSVLSSPDYEAVVGRPTAWSRSMRPALTRMYRRGCVTTISLGAGLAGHLAAVLLRRDRTDPDIRIFDAVAEGPGMFEPQPDDLPDMHGILLVEGFDEGIFRTSLDRVDALIAQSGYAKLTAWTCYRLAFALDETEAEDTLPASASFVDPSRNCAL